MPPNRNDPCPCGSGLKYKKCCMSKDLDPTSSADELRRNYALAFRLMADRDWTGAIDKFKTILDSVPDRHKILSAIGACFDGMDEYLTAAEYYEKALASCPESERPDTLYRLGMSRACAQRIDKAADAFRRCVELAGNSSLKQDASDLLRVAEQIQKGEKRSEVFFILVQLLKAFGEMDEERYESAADRLERLASVDPDNSVIFYNLGVVYTLLKKERAALENFQRAVTIQPDYPEAWYNMGQISLIHNKDFSRALNCFSRAVAIRPDYIGARHQMGVAHELMGDIPKAIQCWEKTLELDPKNDQARNNIQRVRAASGT